MKSIAIVTDSNCGMSPAQARELGVHMLPMPFFIDDKEYLEDIDMNQAEFFRHLEQNPGCRVSTSQPTPESVTDLWDKLLKDYDEIVPYPHVQRTFQLYADSKDAFRRLRWPRTRCK